jgi:uncharacterized SAM-binding protein YcdF (DUF218 family)
MTIEPIPSAQPRARRSPWQVLRWTLTGLVAAAAMFGLGFVAFSTYVGALSTPQQVEPADGIIVLTGGQARVDTAVGLLKSGKGKRLLISGVNRTARLEDLRKATGGDRRMFNCCVDIDYEALDTIGNAAESAKWVREHGYDSVILVTNNYHIPRSLLEMHRLLGDATLQAYPVVNSRLDGGSWMTKPEAIRVLFTEYTKYLVAMARVVVPGASGDGIQVVKASP